MIYHESPYEMQTEMQGDRQRMTTAEKKLKEGGWPAEGRPAALLQFPLCSWLIVGQGKDILRFMVNHDYVSYANGNADAW